MTGTGYGFGSRELSGIPNCVQAQLLTPSAHGDSCQVDRVVEIAFEVDDQTPEDLGNALQRIRELPGVLSLLTVPGIGKQGRPTQQIQILARPESRLDVMDACFRETCTIGLRHRETDRCTLQRHSRVVATEAGDVRVKLSDRPGGWSAKAESRDLAPLEGQQRRQAIRRLAEQAALDQNSEDDPHN